MFWLLRIIWGQKILHKRKLRDNWSRGLAKTTKKGKLKEGEQKNGREKLQKSQSDIVHKENFVFHINFQSFCKPWRKRSKNLSRTWERKKLKERCCPAQTSTAFFGMLISGGWSSPLFPNSVYCKWNVLAQADRMGQFYFSQPRSMSRLLTGKRVKN